MESVPIALGRLSRSAFTTEAADPKLRMNSTGRATTSLARLTGSRMAATCSVPAAGYLSPIPMGLVPREPASRPEAWEAPTW
jgi:hypothetical protein